MYRESLIEKLDMTLDHMQYKQLSESNKTHTEEGEMSETSRAYETCYQSDGISAELIYTGLRTNPDHPYSMRQGGHTRTLTNSRVQLKRHTIRKMRSQS